MSNTPKIIGHGPIRVLALHGWFGDADGWGYLPGLIDTDAYTWAFVTYRGYGERIEETGDYTNAEIVADALAAADALGWDEFAVVGHSMGGRAALQLWLTAPERVTRLVGVAPIGPKEFGWDEDSLALFQGAAEKRENRFGILNFTTGERNSATWVEQMTEYSWTHSTPEAFGAYFTAWGLGDLAPVPTDGHPPVSVIVGEHDPACGPHAVRDTWLASFPDAEVFAIANAGHYPMYEAPVNFVTAVETALSDDVS